jgi:hypothetical protein
MKTQNVPAYGGKIGQVIVLVMATALLPFTFAKGHRHAPLPAKVLTAKTVYLDNKTGYEIFADRAYDEFAKWGRFRVVQSAKDADLVVLLSASVYHGGYVTSGPSQQHGAVDSDGNVNIYGSCRRPFRNVEI